LADILEGVMVEKKRGFVEGVGLEYRRLLGREDASKKLAAVSAVGEATRGARMRLGIKDCFGISG
jgi:hypothetical protein